MKKILICRTDRIGDFILSLPFLSELRAHTSAELHLLVSPIIKPLLKFVKSVDSFLIYDKNRLRTISNMFSFAKVLSQSYYDVVVALNPNFRLHFLLFLSRIPKRFGWNIKGGKFLLTDTLLYTKSKGLMHEAQYNMLFLRFFGIDNWRRPNPTLILDKRLDKWFPRITVGIHVGASCPSKRWSVDKFFRLCKLILKKGMAVVFIGDEQAKRCVDSMWNSFSEKERFWIKNCCGIPLDETVYAISMCDVLVSNDSGPVHIASAVGVPSVVIFGRNDPNLSPRRWKPLHPYSKVIHKASCKVCLAHNCRNNFSCLENISVEDVWEVLTEVLTYVKVKEVRL